MQMRTTHSEMPQYHIEVIDSSGVRVRIIYWSQPLVSCKLYRGGTANVFQVPKGEPVPVGVREDQGHFLMQVTRIKDGVCGANRPGNGTANIVTPATGERDAIHSHYSHCLFDLFGERTVDVEVFSVPPEPLLELQSRAERQYSALENQVNVKDSLTIAGSFRFMPSSTRLRINLSITSAFFVRKSFFSFSI